MTYEEALKELRRLFHKTRFTQDIYVPAEVIAVLLGYKPHYEYNGTTAYPDEN